jgi:hypothetical protein
MKGLSGRRIVGLDGDAGFIVEVYFDDKVWQVRYLVVDTENPMPRREVLVPCASIETEQAPDDRVRVRLTRAQIKQYPDKGADPPVWYQHDLRRASNYQRAALGDPHLRSSAIVIGYGVQTLDGTIGHIEDLLISGTWRIAHLAIDTRNWLPGKRVLIAPNTVERIDWVSREVHLRLTRAEVRRSTPA